MKNSRRLKRMERAHRNKAPGLNLTSLMDVFTILVLYLLVNQSSVQVVEPPKEVVLPDSVAEAKPRETLVVMVSENLITIAGEPLMSVEDVLEAGVEKDTPLKDKLQTIKDSALGLNEEAIAKNSEVTIMAHQKVPFNVLKTLMSVCTSVGYTKISLAVNQKASQG
ncbi:biopolymer transporter ExbD [Pseudomaricurvus sp. HS19]|uniref:ExbD/TolR family protein n=1 Tax=Pseudomaricurvus sp. HS19 TaxID=2692626 RepID=UPI00136D4714|nr:biopolymer transporter ExbD [Pseudomaricurvus sp. HS19]MYM61752.1 biopolymer transporter ExbD [Pseudomaricurvus sp. HS19]